jgi:hypothetical protein
MNMPAHPPHTDSEPAKARPRRRVIIGAVCIVAMLASIHLVRTALG